MKLISALASLGLIICLHGASRSHAATVGIRLSFEPQTLDWNLGDVPIHVINNSVEGLYLVNASGEVKPNEALELPKKLSQNKYRIRLRADLKWSDGKPVRAQDYIYSWERLKNPRTASTYSSLLAEIQNAKAVSDHEIEFTTISKTTALSPNSFTHWATYPLRQDIVEQSGHKNWASKPETMVFNGPYRISSYQRGTKLELVPNPYHRSPGKISKIEALIVTDDATAFRLYESGRLHFMSDLAGLDRSLLTTRKDYFSKASPVLVYIGVHAADPNLRTSSARMALSLAIDREMIPKILDAPHTTTLTPWPSAKTISQLIGGQKPLSLQETRILEFGYYEKGSNRTLVEFVQNQWTKKLKLKTALNAYEVKSYWTKLAQAPFPVFLNSFSPPVWDEKYYFLLLESKNPMNMGRWSNKDYDVALSKQDWLKAKQILEKESPIIPLYFRAYEYLMSPKIKGAVINPMTSLYLDQATLE